MTILNGENESFFGQGIVPTLSDRMFSEKVPNDPCMHCNKKVFVGNMIL